MFELHVIVASSGCRLLTRIVAARSRNHEHRTHAGERTRRMRLRFGGMVTQEAVRRRRALRRDADRRGRPRQEWDTFVRLRTELARDRIENPRSVCDVHIFNKSEDQEAGALAVIRA